MNEPEDLTKLRLAPRETMAETARRIEREKRAEQAQREREMSQCPLAPLRIGSVPYLNGAPLTRGIEDKIVLAPPSRLGELLHKGELDAALVSITFPLLNDGYDILDGIAVASLGEVKSVLLAHKKPPEELTEIFCDTASLTSVNLLRILLAERGLRPEFRPLLNYEDAHFHAATLLIGDAAVEFARSSHDYQIWDLGSAWYDLTKLPFVYAAWVLRRGADTTEIRRALRDARDFGLDTLDAIIASRKEFDYEFRKDYLGWHIHYHLGADEKRGMEKFMELMRKHGIGPLFEPHFVA